MHPGVDRSGKKDTMEGTIRLIPDMRIIASGPCIGDGVCIIHSFFRAHGHPYEYQRSPQNNCCHMLFDRSIASCRMAAVNDCYLTRLDQPEQSMQTLFSEPFLPCLRPYACIIVLTVCMKIL